MKEGLILHMVRTFIRRLRSVPPVRLIVSSFIFIILIGTVLLILPVSSSNGISTNILDSFFTATSATCVTGLIVFDTYTHWSFFGQVVIITLIQLGGLGLITFASGFTLLMRRKLNLRDMRLTQEYTSGRAIDIPRLIRTILFVSFVCEAIGAIVLMIRFIPMLGKCGVWVSIFLAISAYCNAGFDILGFWGPHSSLEQFATDPLVTITICILIILGGIGFIVITDVYSFILNKIKHDELHPHLTLHSKIVLITSASLLVFGTIVVLILEYNDTLIHMNIFEKINVAFFQSCTSRTAGFSTLNQNDLRDITKIVTILLMFIGASPSSTGGGTKTTTFVVLMASVISVLRGKSDTEINHRRVDKTVVYKSLTITVLAIIVVVITTSIISLDDYQNGATSLKAVFEAVSAFATVGVSTGITHILSLPSKLALIITMFIGRVGPISLVLALTLKHNSRSTSILPEGKVIVG